MQRFRQFIPEQTEQPQYLEEKQIMFNNGARYGQVVFLAGGAGSGKGFVLKNFMQEDLFKVRDVDQIKLAYLKLNQLKDRYTELRGLNLRRPKDVFKLHQFVENKGIVDKTLNYLLGDATNPNTLPNIVFDVTLKNIKKLYEILPLLEAVGYNSRNIHLAWVLTNYSVAVRNNAQRDRIVPDDILLQTHEGAATTMMNILLRGALPKAIDGQIVVVLNNRENTIFWADAQGRPIKNSRDQFVIKDFTRLILKKPGKRIDTDLVQKQLLDWVKSNAPKSFLTKEFM